MATEMDVILVQYRILYAYLYTAVKTTNRGYQSIDSLRFDETRRKDASVSTTRVSIRHCASITEAPFVLAKAGNERSRDFGNSFIVGRV